MLQQVLQRVCVKGDAVCASVLARQAVRHVKVRAQAAHTALRCFVHGAQPRRRL